MPTLKQLKFRKMIKEIAEQAHPSPETSLQGILIAGVDILLDQQGGTASNVTTTEPVKSFDMFRDVVDFHKKYGIQYDGSPRLLDKDYAAFRIARQREEIQEYSDAVEAGDLEAQLDALIDLIYIALGTAHLQGFARFNEGWKRVHEANMRKELSSPKNPGKYGALGDKRDIVKPAGWVAPDLSDLVV